MIWKRGKIVQPWRYAEEVCIPKEEKSKNIDQFRVISLLSVESKIFFIIMAKRLFVDYYSKFSLRVSTGQLTSDWPQLEEGIITDCTISVTLFALAMNMLVKATEKE